MHKFLCMSAACGTTWESGDKDHHPDKIQQFKCHKCHFKKIRTRVLCPKGCRERKYVHGKEKTRGKTYLMDY